MDLSWIKCDGAQWCQLSNVNLAHSHFDGLEGIYIIWHGQPNPAVVYVGQGNIRDRLTQHRQNPAILAYQNQGLYVTWAGVEAQYRDGIERFLADLWRPKVGEQHPSAVSSITVNSPWQ
ncbi:MAG: GIY-YIG nuclease family protein [Candidatus Omnitrophica bacterium]|nr:GIY-YIG nuclease family protein [Candidatus Omnitrophota bacterium]